MIRFVDEHGEFVAACVLVALFLAWISVAIAPVATEPRDRIGHR